VLSEWKDKYGPMIIFSPGFGIGIGTLRIFTRCDLSLRLLHATWLQLTSRSSQKLLSHVNLRLCLHGRRMNPSLGSSYQADPEPIGYKFIYFAFCLHAGIVLNFFRVL
jgi:hypothetical protein